MKKLAFNFLVALLFLDFINLSSNADDNLIPEKNFKETEINLFTGLFDFSDDKQKAGLIGLQHQNEDLFRESFLGKLSPLTGGFLTENNAFYL